MHPDETSHPTAFEIYLRTGRRSVRGAVERKFNPWHDPEDGRFTFKDRGRYFPNGAGGARSPRVEAHRAVASPRDAGGGFTQETDAARSQYRNDPQNPRNHAIHIVRKGDNLTRIAATRKGLTVADLAQLNGIPVDRPLGIGQRLKIPHQRYLDDGRGAKNKFLALTYYMRTHGRMPPNPAKPPSLQSQILDSNWRRESRNGYDYQIDIISRPRRASGLITLAEKAKRSRKSQGSVPDRAEKDDGGHYIAARFNGPTDSFNHFAQNANFNRGGYRVLEDLWAAETRAGKKVFVDIVPHYQGASRRPWELGVTWYVDGRKYFKNFPNKAADKKNGKR